MRRIYADLTLYELIRENPSHPRPSRPIPIASLSNEPLTRWCNNSIGQDMDSPDSSSIPGQQITYESAYQVIGRVSASGDDPADKDV